MTCQNGAPCIDGGDSYTCDRVAGYDGDLCETAVWAIDALPYAGSETNAGITIDISELVP